MGKCWEVAKITLREAISKNHIYVLMILTMFIFFGASYLNFFELEKDTGFYKIIPMFSIPLLCIIIATFAAARQIPTERNAKTLYPLLAKPIKRYQFIIGKYIGVEIISLISMVVLTAVFVVIMMGKGAEINKLFYQAIFLLFLQCSIHTALVLFLSTALSYEANITISLSLYFFLQSIGRDMELSLQSDLGLPQATQSLYTFFSTALPRYDYFNITKAVLHNWTPLSNTVLLPFIGYASLYIFVFLGLGILIFRNKEI